MAPARDQIAPDSRRTDLRLFFAVNPGQHRAKDVAAALGIPPGKGRTQLTNELARMAREGKVERIRTVVEGRKSPITYYRQPTATPAEA